MEDNRPAIFQQLKQLLKVYEPPFTARKDSTSGYELWSIKDVEIAGKKRNEVFFASVVVQSTYVGFYFMPVYTDAAMKKFFKKELLSTLKGKSCFHIKDLDPRLIAQIRDALKRGFALYKKNKWV
ncbi:MAG: DUF1801 domain-containing protein [Bacteroidetes bacterium]|nr:DUF1801 domain-containing protein [Bacteroidota bacterium]